jgi:Family of unknown function (DUF5670)
MLLAQSLYPHSTWNYSGLATLPAGCNHGCNRGLAKQRQTRIPVAIRGLSMLWPVFVMLLILWLAGVVAGYTLGGFIHLLLALAVIVLLAQVITRSEREPGSAKTHPARRDAEKEDRPDDEKAA